MDLHTGSSARVNPSGNLVVFTHDGGGAEALPRLCCQQSSKLSPPRRPAAPRVIEPDRGRPAARSGGRPSPCVPASHWHRSCAVLVGGTPAPVAADTLLGARGTVAGAHLQWPMT